MASEEAFNIGQILTSKYTPLEQQMNGFSKKQALRYVLFFCVSFDLLFCFLKIQGSIGHAESIRHILHTKVV